MTTKWKLLLNVHDGRSFSGPGYGDAVSPEHWLLYQTSNKASNEPERESEGWGEEIQRKKKREAAHLGVCNVGEHEDMTSECQESMIYESLPSVATEYVAQLPLSQSHCMDSSPVRWAAHTLTNAGRQAGTHASTHTFTDGHTHTHTHKCTHTHTLG